jgi:sulfide:quinone oxidoreductase
MCWPLPIYELALMTAARLVERDVPEVRLDLVTPEDQPLGLFGRQASEAIAALLSAQGIEVHTASHPVEFRDGRLELVPKGSLEADQVIALGRLRGVSLPGLPQDAHGFLNVGVHGLVDGLANVYAAGDITRFPVKQGGIATQQADAAAESIAARFGAPLRPRGFRPVLRGLLLSNGEARYLRAEIVGGHGDRSEVSKEALWRPGSKVAGRFLSTYLAHTLPRATGEAAAPIGSLPAMAIELDPSTVGRSE